MTFIVQIPRVYRKPLTTVREHDLRPWRRVDKTGVPVCRDLTGDIPHCIPKDELNAL